MATITKRELIRHRRLFTTVNFNGMASGQLFERMGWALQAIGIFFQQFSFAPGSTPTLFDLIKKKLGVEEIPKDYQVPASIWREKFLHWAEWIQEGLDLGRWIHVKDYYQYRAVDIAVEKGLTGDYALKYVQELCLLFERDNMPTIDVGVVLADPRLDSYFVVDGVDRFHYGHGPNPKYLAKRDLFLQLIAGDPAWHIIRFGLDEFPEYHEGLPIWDERAGGLWREHMDVELEQINLVLGPELAISAKAYEKVVRAIHGRFPEV